MLISAAMSPRVTMTNTPKSEAQMPTICAGVSRSRKRTSDQSPIISGAADCISDGVDRGGEVQRVVGERVVGGEAGEGQQQQHAEV